MDFSTIKIKPKHTDYVDLCRICAKQSKNLISLGKTKKKGKTLGEMLIGLLENTIDVNADRPSNICITCMPKLIAAFELQYMARNSEELFQKQDLSCSESINCSLNETSEFIDLKPLVEDFHETISNESIEMNDEKLDLESKNDIQVKVEEIFIDKPIPLIITDESIEKDLLNHHCTLEKRKRKKVQKRKQFNISDVNELAPMTFECFDCKQMLRSRKGLFAHMKKHNTKCPVCNSTENYGNHLCNEAEYIQCQYCQKPFKSIQEILQHLENETKLNYKCDQCNQTFYMETLLQLHAVAHKNQTFPCNICGKNFGHKKHRTNHIRFVHSNERPYICEECGKSFKTSSCLKKHLFIHTESRPFACPECPSTFRRKGGLKEHIAQLHGSEKHECKICGAVMKTLQVLRYHQKRHSDVSKNKECEVCKMKFSNNYKLTRHMIIHTGERPFKCSYCDRAYTQSGDLNKHLRTHVGENIYKCNICSMAFRLPWELRRHSFEHYKQTTQQSE